MIAGPAQQNGWSRVPGHHAQHHGVAGGWIVGWQILAPGCAVAIEINVQGLRFSEPVGGAVDENPMPKVLTINGLRGKL